MIDINSQPQSVGHGVNRMQAFAWGKLFVGASGTILSSLTGLWSMRDLKLASNPP
jgi:hypothetical protein